MPIKNIRHLLEVLHIDCAELGVPASSVPLRNAVRSDLYTEYNDCREREDRIVTVYEYEIGPSENQRGTYQ